MEERDAPGNELTASAATDSSKDSMSDFRVLACVSLRAPRGSSVALRPPLIDYYLYSIKSYLEQDPKSVRGPTTEGVDALALEGEDTG